MDSGSGESSLSKLREKAEAFVSGMMQEKEIAALSLDEIKRMVQDLWVHQIELEMQNDELRRIQCELEASRDRLSVLFNMAPVGYLTVDKHGIILQCNQTLADMLHVELPRLENKAFAEFIDLKDRPIFLARFKAFFKKPAHKSLEVRLNRKGRPSLWAELEGRSLERSFFPGQEDNDTSVLVIAVNDISKRKRAEEERQLTLKRTSETLESISDGFLSLDLDLVVNYFNSAAEKLLGKKRTEVLGKEFFSVFSEMQGTMLEEHFRKALLEMTFVSFETHFRQGSHTIWHEVRIYPHPSGISVYFQSVTDRKRGEEALRKSELRYRTIVETAREGIGSLDKDFRTSFVNQRLAEMLGYTVEEMLGRPLTDFIPAEELESFAQRSDTRKAGSGGVYELAFRHKNGTIRHMIVSVTPTLDDKGRFDGSFAMFTDITDRKRAEAALRENEENLAITLQSIGDAVITTDVNGWISRMNPVAETLTGWRFEQARGRQLSEVFQTFDAETGERVFNPIDAILRAGPSTEARRTSSLASREGIKRLISESGTPIMNSQGQVVGAVLVFRDVTEQVKLEQQYRQAHKMEAVGQLAGGVAHDFNNLLQVILGHLDIVLAEIPTDSAFRKRLNQVQKAVNRATTLVRQLLAFSRRQTMQMAKVDLNQTIMNLLKMLRRLIGEHIELDFNPGYPLRPVKADPGQIEQVLMNLALNSRDAMPDGGRITIQTQNVNFNQAFSKDQLAIKAGEYVMISFADTGRGIPKDLHEHVFEPFFTTKEIGKGTGLGLSTVYGVIKQHGGSIHLQSELGHGTTFRVYLPALQGVADDLSQDSAILSSHQGFAPVVSQRATILLAEDDPMVREIAVELLQKAGYTVLVASDGDSARFLFNEHVNEVDLVILDVVMPRASGRVVADHIKGLRPELPILFCSGYAPELANFAPYLSEELDLLQKPYQPQELLERVRLTLGR